MEKFPTDEDVIKWGEEPDPCLICRENLNHTETCTLNHAPVEHSVCRGGYKVHVSCSLNFMNSAIASGSRTTYNCLLCHAPLRNPLLDLQEDREHQESLLHVRDVQVHYQMDDLRRMTNYYVASVVSMLIINDVFSVCGYDYTLLFPLLPVSAVTYVYIVNRNLIFENIRFLRRGGKQSKKTRKLKGGGKMTLEKFKHYKLKKGEIALLRITDAKVIHEIKKVYKIRKITV